VAAVLCADTPDAVQRTTCIRALPKYNTKKHLVENGLASPAVLVFYRLGLSRLKRRMLMWMLSCRMVESGVTCQS